MAEKAVSKPVNVCENPRGAVEKSPADLSPCNSVTTSVEDLTAKPNDTEAVSFIKKGSVLTKVRSVGRRYRRNFFVDDSGTRLQYSDSRKNQCSKWFRRNEKDQSRIAIKNIVEIRDGIQPGSVFYPFRSPLHHSSLPCFTIFVGEELKPLDLVAPNSDLKDKWVRGLQYLLKINKDTDPEHVEIAWLNEKFQEADVNNDGKLALVEIVKLLQSLSFCPLQTESVSQICKTTEMSKSEFVEFYRKLSKRQEIDVLFQKYAVSGMYLDLTQLVEFFKQEQGESLDVKDAKRMIRKNEPCHDLSKNKQMSFTGFINLLASERMNIRKPLCRTVYQDMTQPLSHYFINSSHNTYLEGHQLHGVSSVQQYIRVLTHRCRCVELDVWDGEHDEPIIYHGYTWTTKVKLKDVLAGIKEFAFKKSEYPLILSIENHCSIVQQRKMAKYFRNIFGSRLLTEPLSEDCTCLPSPEALKGKVIIKGKKLSTDVLDGCLDEASVSSEDEAAAIDDEHVQSEVKKKTTSKDKIHLAVELSNCIVICQSASFSSFAASKAKQTFANISSFEEDNALKLAMSESVQFVRHNAWQLSRIYPDGLRTNSTNYNPIPMWNVGCQVVALNFQTRDDPLLLNYGRFEDNGACGYVLKPEFMRSEKSSFDCTKPMVAGAIQTLTVRVISGYILPKKTGDRHSSILDPYVKVEVTGVPLDCKTQQTQVVRDNGFNPVWNATLPQFTIMCPELALVMFRVVDFESSQRDVTVAQYCLPFTCIQTGYRMVALRDSKGYPVGPTSLFVHITIDSIKQ